MKLNIVFLVLQLLISSTYLIAQIPTVELEEVIIEGLSFEKFTSGSKIQKSDSLQMEMLGQGTLSDYLIQNTTVYVKEQGNNMLASISFRGTGSSHTGVYWYGINLNSLTLGNSDFNGYPLFLFDEVAVHYGGASSLHGSDAIGGSVHLNSNPNWIKGSKIHFKQDVGSFGNIFSGAKLNIGNGKWESKTSVYNRLLKNNFTYTITDRLGDGYEIEQENANIHNFGILQEFNSKTSDHGYLSLNAWFGKNDHQVQPMMVTSPTEEQTGDHRMDRNLRLIARYQHFFNKSILNSSLGYVWDYQLYNDSDLIETKRILANLGWERNIGSQTVINVGGNTQYIVPNVWSYEEGLTEWRNDLLLSINHEPIRNLEINLNGRKTFVPFTSSPVAPSLSTSYKIEKRNTQFLFRVQAERSYRVPTFNDRYWGVQGRPDLKAEYGYSMEIGHNFQQKFNNNLLEFDIATYYMIIDDWIAWKPVGNLWRPFNLKKVRATGVEWNGKYQVKINKSDMEIGGLYAYNKSVLLEGISEDDPSVGYQLPYTPKHRAALFANLTHNKYRFSMNGQYTGERNGIDVINEKIEDYTLINLSLSRNFLFGGNMLSVEGQVRNVFDAEYQNVNRYAMPGRNYLISIQFFINNKL